MASQDVTMRLSLKDRRRFQKGLDDSARSLDGVGDAAGRVDRKARRAGGGGLGIMERGLGGIVTVARRATTVLGVAAGAFGALGIRTYASMEQAEIGFTTMLGSGEKARSFLDDLEEFGKGTPFDFLGLAENSQRLLAMGFAADEILPMMTAVGDAVAGLGTGEEGLDAVTRALGQIQAKGKASAEEMLQLTEAGIRSWDHLADALNTDVATAMDKVSDGAVDSATTIDAVLAGMSRDFGGLMDAQSRSMRGLGKR